VDVAVGEVEADECGADEVEVDVGLERADRVVGIVAGA
jgi:hypothetical protein